MITDLLLVDGDLAFDHDVRIISDEKSILQSAIENISIVYGEIPINDGRGNKIYGRRIKLTDISMQQVTSDCKDAILYDNRIKDVVYIVAVRDGMFGCSITFTLLTNNNVLVNGNTRISLV